MIIYLINAETNEIKNEYDNVITWGYNFIEFLNNSQRCKIYCNENEYFTDQRPDVEVVNDTN